MGDAGLFERIVEVQSAFIGGAPVDEVCQRVLEACVEAVGAEAAVLRELDVTLACIDEPQRLALEAFGTPTPASRRRAHQAGVGHLLALPCIEAGVVVGGLVLASPREIAEVDADRLAPLVAAVARLLTSGLAARRRLEAQAREVADAVAAVTDGAFEYEIPTGVIRYSARFLEMLGLEAPGPSVGEWAAMTHPEDAVRQNAALEAHYFGRAPLYQAEYRCRHARTGSGVWLAVPGRIVERRADGTPVKLLGSHIDISARKELEAQLARTDRLSSLGTMAAGMAHEINNPLAFMRANLEFVRHQLVTPLAPEAVAEVDLALEETLEGATRIGRIVQGLRLFSTTSREERKPVEVAEVVRAALRLSGAMLSGRAPVVTEVPDGLVVLGDEHELVQVLVNLLINAAQALPPSSRVPQEVRVTARVEAGLVHLEVLDTGRGVPSEHLRRVFDPFFTTKPLGEGTGLGLAICHSLITAHGGDISLANRPEGGCCVTVRLPAATWRSLDTPIPTAAVTAPALRARVLVIDDEPLMRSALQRGLGADHDVVLAAGGHEALGMMQRDARWHVVLCDVMMGSMSGLELLERVREQVPHLAERVVFLTGGAYDPELRRRLEALPHERLEKPVSLLALRDVIRRRVESTQLEPVVVLGT